MRKNEQIPAKSRRRSYRDMAITSSREFENPVQVERDSLKRKRVRLELAENVGLGKGRGDK